MKFQLLAGVISHDRSEKMMQCEICLACMVDAMEVTAVGQNGRKMAAVFGGAVFTINFVRTSRVWVCLRQFGWIINRPSH